MKDMVVVNLKQKLIWTKSRSHFPPFLCFIIILIIQGTIISGAEESHDDGQRNNSNIPSTTTGNESIELTDGNYRFTHNLYKSFGTSKNRPNLVFSPFSLAIVLAMTKLGARGETAKEIGEALGFPGSDQNLIQSYEYLLKHEKNTSNDEPGGFTLTTANRLYVQENFPILQNYSESIIKIGGSCTAINFLNDVGAAKKINDWVMNATHGKINDLVSPDQFTIDTRMVLVNGVHFKGSWETPFDPSDTRPGPFFVNATHSVEVPMMNLDSQFWSMFSHRLDAHILQLPYKEGNRVSMLLYIPKSLLGLRRVAMGLGSLSLTKIFEQLTYSRLQVTMPKFKIESLKNLVEPLKRLGIRTMFDDLKADFTKISDQGPLFVSQIVQKAFIEVDEAGTEAAAATGGMIHMLSLPPSLRADRPFLFQIVDRPTNLILFTGRLTNPTSD